MRIYPHEPLFDLPVGEVTRLFWVCVAEVRPLRTRVARALALQRCFMLSSTRIL